MKIEQTIYSNALPVNSRAILNRLTEVLEKHETNNLTDIKDTIEVQELIWLLNVQVFGQFFNINHRTLWEKLRDRRTKEEKNKGEKRESAMIMEVKHRFKLLPQSHYCWDCDKIVDADTVYLTNEWIPKTQCRECNGYHVIKHTGKIETTRGIAEIIARLLWGNPKRRNNK